MRAVLLTTSVLSVAAFAVQAENPKVTLGGFADFQAGWVDDDLETAGGQRGHGFRNDTEVTVHVDGKTDQGLGYGAVIDLEADVTDDADNQGTNASRTYVYTDGGWGRVQLGSAEGADQVLKVDAVNIARATGGIDGDWQYFANQTPAAGGLSNAYVSSPRLIAAHGSGFALGDESTINDNKITYYSPRWYGAQLGISYTPDITDRGQALTRSNGGPAVPATGLGGNTQAGDIFSGGINYEAQWNEISFGASLTGEYGDADNGSGLEDLRTWAVGMMGGWAGFQAAASYGYWGDSLNVSGNENTDYYTLGLAYNAAAWEVSATYFKSEFDVATDDNEFRLLSVGADWKLAPGLTPYIEANFYRMYPAAGTSADNDGTVVIVGTELAF